MILQTKLYRPETTPEMVDRGRLHEALDANPTGVPILVSAPAGYGKSMLVSQWTQSRPEPCAWLSLDTTDSSLVAFLEYFVAAVRTAIPHACTETQALLESIEMPPVNTLASCLGNDLEAIQTRFILVLDDLHNITNPEIYQLLDVLLKHPPRSMCLAMISRRDPPLALSKLRASGKLTELRLPDLKFNTEETASLLEMLAGFCPSSNAVLKLHAKLEGWAVGLRLVLLILRDEPNPKQALEGLEVDSQLVEEYLLLEVLNHQSLKMRNWLIRTSILDRFSASLCDAVCTNPEDSDAERFHGETFIQALTEKGLFTIELDSKGEWYRYHHIFQRLLQDQLKRDVPPNAIAALHTRASQSLESQGLISEAIDHALSTENPDAAADIVERARHNAQDQNQWHEIESWLTRLPESVRGERLGLLMAEAFVSDQSYQLQRLETVLKRAESLEGDRTASAERLYYHGVSHFWEGEGVQAREAFDQALELLPEGDTWIRGDSEVLRALALHISDRSDEAVRHIETLINQRTLTRGRVWGRLTEGLSLILLMRGELGKARESCTWLLDSIETNSDKFLVALNGYILGNAAFQSFELTDALGHLRLAATRRSTIWTQYTLDGLAGLALTYQLTGQAEKADTYLAQAREFARWSNYPDNLVTVNSCAARVALLRGDLDVAERWQKSYRETGSLGYDMFFIEVSRITECRVLLARDNESAGREAAEKLKLLEAGYRDLSYIGNMIEVGTLSALLHQQQGNTDQALTQLQRMLALAAPNGWLRPFIEAGAPMADLLSRLPSESADNSFVQTILSAISEGPDSFNRNQTALLPEDLTNRERDVLDLLAERLRDKEIAERLFISPQTVKTHLRSLYQKLGCKSRRTAVAKALELKLFRKIIP